MERTLIILKPDAVQRSLVGAILARFEAKGLKIAAMKLLRISRALAETHYAPHKGKDFYEPLLEFITAGPVVAAVLEGQGAYRGQPGHDGTHLRPGCTGRHHPRRLGPVQAPTTSSTAATHPPPPPGRWRHISPRRNC